MIGLPTKTVRRGSTIGLHGGADPALPTAGPLPPPWRYDDHYGDRHWPVWELLPITDV